MGIGLARIFMHAIGSDEAWDLGRCRRGSGLPRGNARSLSVGCAGVIADAGQQRCAGLHFVLMSNGLIGERCLKINAVSAGPRQCVLKGESQRRSGLLRWLRLCLRRELLLRWRRLRLRLRLREAKNCSQRKNKVDEAAA